MNNNKISTVVTQTKYGDEVTGVAAITQWSEVVPKIYVCGPIKPVQAFGVRYLGQDPKSLRWLLAAYMGTMPGGETFGILTPDVTIAKDQTKLFDEIQRQRIGMAWAAHIDIGGLPKAFLMASSVAAHILMQIPNTISVTGNDWSVSMDEWLGKYMMKPRYINATEFGIITPTHSPSIPKPKVLSEVANAYEIRPPPPFQQFAKRGRPVKKQQLQDVGTNPSNLDKVGGGQAGV